MNLPKNRVFLGLALVAVILVWILLYRSWRSSSLDVEPHAAGEIEKAKGR
jgi:hypothetical protein